jgi:hypothetical protein
VTRATALSRGAVVVRGKRMSYLCSVILTSAPVTSARRLPPVMKRDRPESAEVAKWRYDAAFERFECRNRNLSMAP